MLFSRHLSRGLLENGLFVKAEKCEFHVATMSFLGFIIQQGQLFPNPAKVQAVAEWPTATTWKKLQRSLGNFYRQFLWDNSRVPLTKTKTEHRGGEAASMRLLQSPPDPPERNYDVGNRELLAMALVLQEWLNWLEGAPEPFTVWTDHKHE